MTTISISVPVRLARRLHCSCWWTFPGFSTVTLKLGNFVRLNNMFRLILYWTRFTRNNDKGSLSFTPKSYWGYFQGRFLGIWPSMFVILILYTIIYNKVCFKDRNSKPCQGYLYCWIVVSDKPNELYMFNIKHIFLSFLYSLNLLTCYFQYSLLILYHACSLPMQ